MTLILPIWRRMAKKQRLDKLVVERALAPSRERARSLILAGLVSVDGQPATKAGSAFPENSSITLKENPCPYVSRGGLKLAGALDVFGVDPFEKYCMDVGASTGGFTDVLLTRGARRVASVDVGKGLIDWKLRNDPRVTLLEGVNARHLTREIFQALAGEERPGLCVVDVSFISVMKVVGPIHDLLEDGGEMLVLIKPQFEVGKGRVGKGGIIRDPELHREVLLRIWDETLRMKLAPQGISLSAITGAKGNREFFLYLKPGANSPGSQNVVENVLAKDLET
ncbi:MAG: TlyA family RNA methyltransferase [Nitrospinae bacterium]|nr:TlyA family RNA methyltransferase [Nitrospinota bacterium]